MHSNTPDFAALASVVPAGVLADIHLDGRIVQKLQEQLEDLVTQMKAIQARADAEERSLTQEEESSSAGLYDQFLAVEADIERRQKLSACEARIEAPMARKIEPDLPRSSAAQAQRVNAAPIDREDEGRHGFRHMGEMALAVVKDAMGVGEKDHRLTMAAPSSVAREGVGSEGGFLVPPEFRREIEQLVYAEGSLIARTDKMKTSSNSMSLPVDDTAPWEPGGVQAYWMGETSQYTGNKPGTTPIEAKLGKLGCLVQVTEELLEDAPAMGSYIMSKAPVAMDWVLSEAIFEGTGAGQPLGMLGSGAMVTVPKESAQVADTITFNNIVGMWGRLHTRCRPNAIWLINSDLEPELIKMQVPGVGGHPAYLPPGGVSGSPYATLLGRPVVAHEVCKALGDKGDINLVDMSKYLTLTRDGGFRAATSMHLKFDQDIQTFKFTLRVGGMPWWKKPFERKNGGNTLSCFVTLADRA